MSVSDNRTKVQIGNALVFELGDFTDFTPPMVVFAIYQIGERVSIPGFTVGVPLNEWHKVKRAFTEFAPSLGCS